MSASPLMREVAALGAPYGLERSVKLVPGALQEDRFLVSLHRTAFGTDVAARLMELARKLKVPEGFAEAIARAEPEADIIHLGYEGGAHATYKIYLEYASHVRRAQAEGADAPVLVHLAFKWMPGRAGQGTVTRYTWQPCRSFDEIAAQMRTLLPEDEASRALGLGLEVLARSAKRTQARDLFLMDVEEPGNPRRSYDLNVYQADLCVRDIADVIGSLSRDFALPTTDLDALLAGRGHLALGHIAGGRGRDGSEFATVYYGVEGR